LVELQNRINERAALQNDNKEGPPAATFAAIVGNPYYHKWMEQLPCSQSEANAIHDIMTRAGKESKLLITQSASKEAVMKVMKDAVMIHLASHGSKDGIFLSGLTKEKWKLTMEEVQKLDLHRAKMVVLSACNTFKGDVRIDGLVGITRAFIAAGSPTVVASLWRVNDKITGYMMTRLYDILFPSVEGHGEDHCASDMDVCSALQQVMIEMKDQYSVEEWAPFLMYGLNDGPIRG